MQIGGYQEDFPRRRGCMSFAEAIVELTLLPTFGGDGEGGREGEREQVVIRQWENRGPQLLSLPVMTPIFGRSSPFDRMSTRPV